MQERIRKIVDQGVLGKHAFIPEADATRKGDIGVENASPEAIRRALGGSIPPLREERA